MALRIRHTLLIVSGDKRTHPHSQLVILQCDLLLYGKRYIFVQQFEIEHNIV